MQGELFLCPLSCVLLVLVPIMHMHVLCRLDLKVVFFRARKAYGLWPSHLY
jgi:hypothetical protein